MEKIHPLSKVVIPSILTPKTMCGTTIGVKEHYATTIPLLTSVESSVVSRQFEFCVMPCLASELDVKSSNLVMKLQVMKNGEPCNTSDQPSLVNFPGASESENESKCECGFGHG